MDISWRIPVFNSVKDGTTPKEKHVLSKIQPGSPELMATYGNHDFPNLSWAVAEVYTAWRLATSLPNASICLFERHQRLGGIWVWLCTRNYVGVWKWFSSLVGI